MEAKKKLFHSRPLFYGFLALLLSISTAKYIFEGSAKYIVFDAIILLAFVIYCLWAKKIVSLMVVLCLFAFGLGWFCVGLSMFKGKSFEGTCQVVGRASDDIQASKFGNEQTIVLKDVYINGQKESNIRLCLDLKKCAEVKPGDIINFQAEIKQVPLFELGKFNSFYYRDRTPYTCEISGYVSQGNKLDFDEIVRLKSKEVLFNNMGERNGGAAFAVLFGDKSGVDDDIYTAFKSAGVIHLLTVSGLHVSFLIVLLAWVLRKCRIKGLFNFLLCSVFLGVYAYFCSFSPSILRAGIMGLILFSTRICGKCYDNLNSLGLAGILILTFMPLAALDLGFLMSFFCVLAIYTISPILTKLFRKIFPQKIAESFAVSIGVEIGIFPFLAMMGSGFNFLTFFVNLIVIPIFSVVYPLLFLSCAICMVMPFMGFLLNVCGGGLSIITKIAEFFGQTALQVQLKPFDIFFVASLFVGLFLLSRFFMAKKKTKAICCGGLFALSALILGLSQVQFPIDSSLSYCYNYSNSVVVLTNKQGQSVAVDLTSKAFTEKMLEKLDIKKISAVFVLQKSTLKIDTANALGVDCVIRCDKGEGYENEVLVESQQQGTVGGFSFVYLSHNNKVFGLEISFDQTTVFILRDTQTAAAAIETWQKKDYDFAILGRQNCGWRFDESCTILTYHQDANSNASFLENGNIAFKIDGNKYLRRNLD